MVSIEKYVFTECFHLRINNNWVHKTRLEIFGISSIIVGSIIASTGIIALYSLIEYFEVKQQHFQNYFYSLLKEMHRILGTSDKI